MSEQTFIPNGPSFIANVVLGTQFNANIVADSPSGYVRVFNIGDLGGNNTAIFAAVQGNTTAPKTIDAVSTGDPAWFAAVNGTYIPQGDTVIISVDNTFGDKRPNPILFMANADSGSTGSSALVFVQSVKPL